MPYNASHYNACAQTIVRSPFQENSLRQQNNCSHRPTIIDEPFG